MTKHILIDPGHSQGKPGAHHAGIREEDLVYDIGIDVADYLSQWPYLSVRLSRPKEGPHKPYGARALEALALHTDLVVCLHADTMEGDEHTHGLTTYHLADDMIGAAAADVISRSAPAPLLRRMDLRCVGAKKGDYTERAYLVLDAYHALGLSVVLVELGFLTSSRDRQALLAPETRPAIGACIATGVARMIELTHSLPAAA